MNEYKYIQGFVADTIELDSDVVITFLLKEIRCRDKRIDELEEELGELKMDTTWRGV